MAHDSNSMKLILYNHVIITYYGNNEILTAYQHYGGTSVWYGVVVYSPITKINVSL
jgi:hypothetical protein